MTAIQKIERYIQETKIAESARYSAGITEIASLASEMVPIEAVALAFSYGKAKGYRAAKAEVRKEA